MSPATFRHALEGWFVMPAGSRMHNQVYAWVGGSMLSGKSPNDPVFSMHHCFVDKLWADWQRRQAQTTPELTAAYRPYSGGPDGHDLDDPMFPWNSGDEVVRPRDMLDRHASGFHYENEPAPDDDPTPDTDAVRAAVHARALSPFLN